MNPGAKLGYVTLAKSLQLSELSLFICEIMLILSLQGQDETRPFKVTCAEKLRGSFQWCFLLLLPPFFLVLATIGEVFPAVQPQEQSYTPVGGSLAQCPQLYKMLTAGHLLDISSTQGALGIPLSLWGKNRV